MPVNPELTAPGWAVRDSQGPGHMIDTPMAHGASLCEKHFSPDRMILLCFSKLLSEKSLLDVRVVRCNNSGASRSVLTWRTAFQSKIWEQFGNKTRGLKASFWASTPTKVVESSSSWRKRVGVEPKISTPKSRRMMVLRLPLSSNWSQLESGPDNSLPYASLSRFC